MAERSEIHIGDYGTEYVFPIYDKDIVEAGFDPSGATTKVLRFRNPGVTALQERAATVDQRMINGVNTWCLSYIVTQADVTNLLFHVSSGLVKMEAILTYALSKWSSNIVSKDYNGEEIRVYQNLS